VGASLAYNFRIGRYKIKLITEYENVTQKGLFGTAILGTLMSGENMTSYLKMVTVHEKAMCVLWFCETKSRIKTQRSYRTQYGKDPPSDNEGRRWLKQFQGTGSVLHRKGT
jgi:hypothetical protein